MNELVFIEKDRVLTDSLIVAGTFKKRHDRVLQDIRELECSKEFSLHNFVESTYINERGREYPRILMTQDGFTLLVMGYTGKKAMEFKEAYIKAFRDMETKLKTAYRLPQTFSEALRLAADLAEENEKMKPKAEYFDALVERKLLTNFRDTAKELKVKEKQFIDWLLVSKYIYRNQKGKLKPYAEYVPTLFEIKEHQREKWTGVQTLITPKGRETFRLLIHRELIAQ